MQVEIRQMNSAKKEVALTVEAERADAAYRKYLNKSAGELSLPGFRKGKAPLSLVERTYGSRIREYFYKDFVDEVFAEAVKEHDLHYLLQPEIMDIAWEPGQEMKLTIGLETEPEINIQQLEGLRVPYKPLELKDEVERYIAELQQENATVADVEGDIAKGDEVDFEVKCALEGREAVTNYSTHIETQHEPQLAPAALGKQVGDTFTLQIPVALARYIFKEEKFPAQPAEIGASFMVNAIRRTILPRIDDEFAKDLEYDSVQKMRDEIAASLEEKNSLKNQNIKINALISKLYVDNRFDLPENTIGYITDQELERYQVKDDRWRQFYRQQILYRTRHEFINMYLMQALRKQRQAEPAETDIEQYIEREAKLSDQSVEAWKEKNKAVLEDESFKETVANYLILDLIASTCEFYEAEPEPAETALGDNKDMKGDELIS